MKEIESLFVRWQRRRTRRQKKPADYRLTAFLVAGDHPEDDSNPNVMAELGSIEERFLRIRISKTRAFHQGLFWVKVDQVFDKLDLEKSLRQILEDEIVEKVPRPADDWALWGVTCIPHIDC